MKFPFAILFFVSSLVGFGLPIIAQTEKPIAVPAIRGVDVPDGFEVIQVAGDELATNVFCMTVSPKGETLVSGPGYIKALIDTDGDKVFDSARLFAAGPDSGAQGMCFDGTDLLCTGDGGLLRFSDADGNGVADGPPTKLFTIKTGGEHDAHAIRKGPDGWWYLLAGNGVPILPEFFANANSPVKTPRAGFLMRISPDWNQKEIFAHGFRNAYDFDFNSLGQVFVYDSDGERDVSLPWYRPTRLFRMRPGDDAGWVTASWKRPSYFFDMPIEVGALGRGSPTGVINCQSASFPQSYRDAIFVADWTFGRIVAFRRGDSGEYDRGTDFAIATGQFGFAVTDLVFDTDGSLLVSTGGRGTKGAIYRIRFEGGSNDQLPKTQPSDRKVALVNRAELSPAELVTALSDSDNAVRVAALESLVGHEEFLKSASQLGAQTRSSLVKGLAITLQDPSPKTLGLLMRIDVSLDQATHDELAKLNLPIAWKLALEIRRPHKAAIESAVDELVAGNCESLVIARLGQLLLGGENDDSQPMFVGYSAKKPIVFTNSELTKLADQIALAISTIDRLSQDKRKKEILEEIGRFAAMLKCNSVNLQKQMVEMAGRGSAQNSIHWLNCLSQIINDRERKLDPVLIDVVSETLAGVTRKIARDKQDIDRNFYPRMKDLANRLCKRVGNDFSMEVAKRLIGEPDEVYLLDVMPPEARELAIVRFASRIESNRSVVSASQLRVLLRRNDETYLPLLRSFADQPDLQAVVVEAVSRFPIPTDRNLFAQALSSFNLTTIKNGAIGLRRLEGATEPDELVAALSKAFQISWDKPSTSVRDQLILLLRKGTGQSFGYVMKKPGFNQTESLAKWKTFLKAKYPNSFESKFRSPNNETTQSLAKRLASVDWSKGDTNRGAVVFKKLQCAQCHDAGSRLGPRLEGISNRFGRDDVFRSIVVPNEQVPDRYRAVMIETVDGLVFQGSIIYQSVEGVTLQEPSGNTVRINREDIESRSVSKKSLMPDGLLSEATDQDWADLFAFLKKL